ncbi:UDP-glucuronate decarboxylase 1, partial [Homo sapiens]
MSLRGAGPHCVLMCFFWECSAHAVRMQITGGAGFVGSHLTDKLMMDGHEVTVVDNFFTGRK